MMIEARFITNLSPVPVVLLAAAHRTLQKARVDAARLKQETRKLLAAKIRTLRRRLIQKYEDRYRIRIATALAQQERIAQTRYYEIIDRAHKDCLNIALKVAREIVGELHESDASRLAVRVEAALKSLTQVPCLGIDVHPGKVRELRDELSRHGVQILVAGDLQVPLGEVRVRTSRGTVSLSWEDEFESIAIRLQTILALKVATLTSPGQHDTSC